MHSSHPLARNLVKNGQFEQLGAHWSATSTPPGSVAFNNHSCLIRTNGMAEQEVTIDGGMSYALSFFSLITYNGTGAVRLISRPSGDIQSIPLTGNHGWSYWTASYSPSAGTTSVTVQLVGTSGEVWIDNVQLKEEEGSVIPIELIRNGDFSANGDGWTAIATPPATATFNTQQSQMTLGGRIEQQITVTPGQSYGFSIDAQTPFGGSGVARFVFTPSSNQELPLSGSGSWDTYTATVNVPLGIPEITLQVESPSNLIVDNLSMMAVIPET